jgi:hypothetical protein
MANNSVPKAAMALSQLIRRCLRYSIDTARRVFSPDFDIVLSDWGASEKAADSSYQEFYGPNT